MRRNSITDSAAPTQQIMRRNASLELNHASVGTNQKPLDPICSRTASRYKPAGAMPCAPINPTIWGTRDTKAMKYTNASPRRKMDRVNRCDVGGISFPQRIRVTQ